MLPCQARENTCVNHDNKKFMLDTAKFLFHKSTIFDMTNYLFFRLLQKTKSLSNCYVYNTACGLLSQ